MEERLYWLGFSVFPGIGPGRFAALLQHFGTAKDSWSASEADFSEVVGKVLAEKFIDFKKNFSLSDYQKRLLDKEVAFFTLQDTSYPQLLAKIKNPPFVLYVKGVFDFNSSAPQVAVVGTRRISPYGTQVTTSFVAALVQAGCVIVSGLAMGVDSVAHGVTINEGGKTVAVLGCGVDCCYPSSNQSLYERILASGGAIVSEFPLGNTPSKGSFPSRNRIIAGLSLGTLVTEGTGDSGALITAKDAFENKRKVFAVPGSVISSLSVGPYALIEKGATLVTKADGVLAALEIKQVRKRLNMKGDTVEEQKILDLLVDDSLHFDDLVRRTAMTSSILGGVLSLMEMRGLVVDLGGGMWGAGSR